MNKETLVAPAPKNPHGVATFAGSDLCERSMEVIFSHLIHIRSGAGAIIWKMLSPQIYVDQSNLVAARRSAEVAGKQHHFDSRSPVSCNRGAG